MSSDFHFLVPESSGLNFCMFTTLCQGQEMTLTFNTHIPSYIQLDFCSYLLSGHWVKIGLPVLEKKIFEEFLQYMGVVAILVM